MKTLSQRTICGLFVLFCALFLALPASAQGGKPAGIPQIEGRLITDWVADLVTGTVQEQNRAMSVVEANAEHSKRWQPVLMQLAKSDDSFAVRARAIQALAKLRIKDTPVRDLLVAALNDNSWQVRAESARALVEFGAEALPALDRLVEMVLTEKAWFAKNAAAAAIGVMRAKAAPAVPKLAKGLVMDDEKIREAAAFALGELGTIAAATAPQLLVATKDGTPSVKRNACMALAQVSRDDKTSLARFKELIGSSERIDQLSALYGLRILAQRKNAEAVSALVKALDSTDYLVQTTCLREMIKIGKAGEVARARAIELQKSEYSKTRNAAKAFLYALDNPESVK